MKLIVSYLLFLTLSCKSDDVLIEPDENQLESDSTVAHAILDSVLIRRTFTENTIYHKGERILLKPFDIVNNSSAESTLDSVVVRIGTTGSNGASKEILKMMLKDGRLPAKGRMNIPATEVVNEEDKLDEGGYLVNVECYLTLRGVNVKKSTYLTFFRISENEEYLNYKINSINRGSLPVFTLNGGLSAEYTVQKAAASLAGGISHSWSIPSPGMGPEPILSTPDFLQRSVRETVHFYDSTFGRSHPFETVIISTGIPSGAYLARSMNAPVLPIHFLVGAHTTKEIQTILDYSNEQGDEAYATIGHDYSLSGTKNVAWIKLLSLPNAYKEFLVNHGVRQMIFHGALGRGGESTARKLQDETEHYAPGSVYLMYILGDESTKYLKETIRDFDEINLGSTIYIADWEAGVTNEQVDGIAADIREETSIEVLEFVTTHDAINLWNLGSFLMLDLLKKNELELKGISLNPYLIGHPAFETSRGYIPFLYWQGFDPQYHLDTRFNTIIRDAIGKYFPETRLEDLSYWVNSTGNFGGYDQGVNMKNTLGINGFEKIIQNDFTVGEEWNTADGMNSSSETRALMILEEGIDDFMEWNSSLKFLTVADLYTISANYSGIVVIAK